VANLAQKLANLPEVEYAEADGRNFVQATPDDPLYAQQWHYFAPVTGTYGANLPGAWDIITGSVNIRVAVLDSGILFDHPDLLNRTLPGYDFVNDPIVANDGDGRDSNAADPGDWISSSDQINYSALFGDCPVLDSSWHGSHVAGTIGAATNNSTGVAGINWNSKILPVRVLGKCFGYTSDIADGIRWAAGLSVAGVPANPTPARVINMSLGGSGACGTTYQSAIDAAVAAGSVVVVAAGNENQNASNSRPANCNNVITVAATNRNGSKAIYSNFGAAVEISAPGGQGGTGSTNAVLSTLNQGTTTPVPNNAFYQFYNGTSMAAPHVAGVVSLMLSINPNLTPAQVLALIQSTATPFPAGSTCSTSNCGSGIINAAAAVQAAQGAPTLNQRVFLPLINRDFSSGSLVPNGDFEQGATVWTQSSSNGRQQIRNSFAPNSVTPYSGAWGVWLGGAFNEQGYIQQTVTVPAGAPYLYFYNWIGSADLQGFDFGYVVINNLPVLTVDLYSGANTGGWVKRVTNLSAYAGQTVTLRIAVTTDDSYNSNWFIDDVGFQSTP
jgi:serine protease